MSTAGKWGADHHSPKAADCHHQTVDERKLRDGKVLRGRLKCAAETDQCVSADQKAARQHPCHAIRQPEQHRPRRREQHNGGRHTTRTVTVEQYARGNLRDALDATRPGVNGVTRLQLSVMCDLTWRDGRPREDAIAQFYRRVKAELAK